MKKLSFSWDSRNFQNGESFSPFLLISWGPMRWGDVLMEGVGYSPFKPLVKWVMFGNTLAGIGISMNHKLGISILHQYEFWVLVSNIGINMNLRYLYQYGYSTGYWFKYWYRYQSIGGTLIIEELAPDIYCIQISLKHLLISIVRWVVGRWSNQCALRRDSPSI